MKSDNPLRVLHVIVSMNRGGAETFIMNIYRNINRRKVQFDFLLHTIKKCDFTEEILSLGGKIYSVSNPAYQKLPTLCSIIKYQNELDLFFKKYSSYQIIHTHMSGRSSEVLKFAKKNNVSARIAHSHIILNQRNLKRLAYEISGYGVRKNSNFFLTCSKGAAVSLFGINKVKKKEIYYLPNAIEVNKFTYNYEYRKTIRKELKISNRFVIGHIGRFDDQKNHKLIIKIFKEIYSLNPNAILLLIGSGPLKTYIQKKIHQLKLDEVVFFLGTRSDVPDLLQAMDVFLFPSKYEGLGIVVIEAQAAGLPTIVSEHIPEEAYVTDLIESVSLKAPVKVWAEKCLEYSNGNKRKDTSEIIIKKGFDVQSTTKWLEEFYLKLVKK